MPPNTSPADSDGPRGNALAAALAIDLSPNRLLGGLPAAELGALRDAAEPCRPRVRQTIYEPGAPMDYVYFPQGAVFSLLAQMTDGSLSEAAMVGREGMLGLPAALGVAESPLRVVCLVAGQTIRVPTAALVAAAPRDGVLFGRLIRYAAARLTSIAQLAACNGLHTAQQRYARWVLTMHDCSATDEFPITQEFLSQLLGVTRPTVSLVAHEFQATGLIHYAQGRLTVDDRLGLEQVSCECYDVIRRALSSSVD